MWRAVRAEWNTAIMFFIWCHNVVAHFLLVLRKLTSGSSSTPSSFRCSVGENPGGGGEAVLFRLYLDFTVYMGLCACFPQTGYNSPVVFAQVRRRRNSHRPTGLFPDGAAAGACVSHTV